MNGLFVSITILYVMFFNFGTGIDLYTALMLYLMP